MVPPSVAWAHLYQLTKKKIPLQTSPQANLQLSSFPKFVKLTTEISHHRDFILGYPERSRVITRFIVIEVCENLFNLLVSVFNRISECSANVSSNILSTLLFVCFWDSHVHVRPFVTFPQVSEALPISFPSIAEAGDSSYSFLVTERENCKILVKERFEGALWIALKM